MRQNEALKIWQDWDESEGSLRWENAKTIERYKELQYPKFDLKEPGVLERMQAFYEVRERRIKEECVPQEVYCYEFNNYESSINGDGDEGALRIIVRYWGREVARKIKRYSDWPRLDDLEARMEKEAANEKA